MGLTKRCEASLSEMTWRGELDALISVLGSGFGAWLLTSGALQLIAGAGAVGQEALLDFQVLVTNTFVLTSLVAGTFQCALARMIGDSLYDYQAERRAGHATLRLPGVTYWIAGVIAVEWALSLTFGLFLGRPRLEQIGIAGLTAGVSSMWVMMTCLLSIGDFASVVRSVAAGMSCTVAFVFLAVMFGGGGDQGVSPSELLLAFDLGVGLSFALMADSWLRRTAGSTRPDAIEPGRLRRLAAPALVGFLTALSIWIDKLVVWFTPHRFVEVTAEGFPHVPHYDSATMIALLTTLPLYGLVLLAMESGLERRVRDIFNAINGEARLPEIEERVTTLQHAFLAAWKPIAIIQLTITSIVFLLLLTGDLLPERTGVSRIAMCLIVFGAAFHAATLLLAAILLHLDRARTAVFVTVSHCSLSAVFTAWTIRDCPSFLGLGYAVSSMLTLCLGLAILHLFELPRLSRTVFLEQPIS